MNLIVVTFFIHTTLAALVLGIKFVARKDPVFKYFGIGLILNALAFATWTVIVLSQVENVELYVTVGAVFFLISLVAYLASGIQNVDATNRKIVIWVGSFATLATLLLRIFVYPSNPSFSPEGYYHFNPHPIMQALEIFGLALVVLPAASALAAKFAKPIYSRLVQYCFIAIVVGGFVLVTSTNATLLFTASGVLGIAFFALWTTLLFNKKAWSGIS